MRKNIKRIWGWSAAFVMVAALVCVAQAENKKAATDEQVILGIIQMIDKEHSLVEIQRVSTGERMVVIIPPEELSALHKGDKIRIWLKADSNVARHVRKIRAR